MAVFFVTKYANREFKRSYKSAQEEENKEKNGSNGSKEEENGEKTDLEITPPKILTGNFLKTQPKDDKIDIDDVEKAVDFSPMSTNRGGSESPQRSPKRTSADVFELGN